MLLQALLADSFQFLPCDSVLCFEASSLSRVHDVQLFSPLIVVLTKNNRDNNAFSISFQWTSSNCCNMKYRLSDVLEKSSTAVASGPMRQTAKAYSGPVVTSTLSSYAVNQRPDDVIIDETKDSRHNKNKLDQMSYGSWGCLHLHVSLNCWNVEVSCQSTECSIIILFPRWYKLVQEQENRLRGGQSVLRMNRRRRRAVP